MHASVSKHKTNAATRIHDSHLKHTFKLKFTDVVLKQLHMYTVIDKRYYMLTQQSKFKLKLFVY